MHTHSLLLFHALLIASAAAAEPWAQFRGSDGQGIATQSKPPLEWSDTKNVRWKVELPGPGASSPIQHGQRVFVTCYSGYGLDLNSPGELRALKRHLICLDAASGKVLWDRSVAADAAEDRKGGPIMAAMGEDLDTCIGTLVQKLDTLGIAQNTFIIYMADNGMGGSLLKGGKNLCDEGGLRVPLIVAGPDIRGGVRASVPVVNFDIFPTVLDLAAPGFALPKGIEGGSWKPVLTQASAAVQRPIRRMVWHHDVEIEHPQTAMRQGNFKLMHYWDTKEDFLYDLSLDLGEKTNLARSQPELVTRMLAELKAHVRAGVGEEKFAQLESGQFPASEGPKGKPKGKGKPKK